jgi:hypothetical protein
VPKKAKPYVPPFPFIEIIWDDAASNSATWVDIADVCKPEQVVTRGWLVVETDDYVSIVSSVSNDEANERNVGNVMTVPKGMIVKRRELSVMTRRPPKASA